MRWRRFVPLLAGDAPDDRGAGGGTALLLDESYNGNGASMRAALDVLRLQPALRRVAVLGDMLELGDEGPAEHAALADAVLGVGGLSVHLRAFDALAVRRSPGRGARISCRGFRRTGAGGSRCPAQRRCGSGEGQPGQRHEARDRRLWTLPDLLRHRRSRLMLYVIFRPLADQFILFNLFRYITFRSGAACLTALVVSFLLGPSVIRWLKSMQTQGQPIRLDGPERHLVEKKGTPTMGGLLILGSLTISTLLWVDSEQRLCMGGAVRHAWLWRVGVLRRLSESHQAQHAWRAGTGEAVDPGGRSACSPRSGSRHWHAGRSARR